MNLDNALYVETGEDAPEIEWAYEKAYEHYQDYCDGEGIKPMDFEDWSELPEANQAAYDLATTTREDKL